MINPHWVILGAAIGLLGLAAYVRDTIRGTTQPNRVTWLLWAVAPLLAFAVEVTNGVGLQSLMTFEIGFGPLIVFGVSFVNPKSVWKISRLDYACGALSVAGTAAWLLTEKGNVALVAAIAADALAALPTIVKSWKAPETETALAYGTAVINAVITLLTVSTWSAAEAAFPLYIACIASVEVVLISGRIGPRVRALRGVAPAVEAVGGEGGDGVAPPSGLA